MWDSVCAVKLPAMCDRQIGPDGAQTDAPKMREKKFRKTILNIFVLKWR